MFFRKRTRVPDFLDAVIGSLLSEGRVFIHEDFISQYQQLLNSAQKREGEGTKVSDMADNEPNELLNRFIGTLLWLIKYRVLSNMFNSPRRQAYLDLNFDLATPEIVDRYFNRYDTEMIKKTYDEMDIGCKKIYTGEMQKEDKPRFLVSPIWARTPQPHPFRVAAHLFMEISGKTPAKEAELETLIDGLEERFTGMTDSAAEAAKKVSLV